MTETITEIKKPSLKEKFARAALGIVGLGTALGIPVITLKGTNIPPELVSVAVGGGIYLFASMLSGSAKTLRQCFTTVHTVVPAAVLGIIMGGLVGGAVHLENKSKAQFEADRLISPRVSPDEIVSETVQQKYCQKSNKPYDNIITINNQKRLLTCP